jgi:citrate lyase subunit gamma (acyl carrier protein)
MAEAGKREKGDVYVRIEDAEGREIVVSSKLMILYGDAIRRTVEEMTSHLNNVRVVVEDFGALDFVIRARLEAALRKYGGEGE